MPQKHSKQNNAHTAFGGWMWSRNLEAPQQPLQLFQTWSRPAGHPAGYLPLRASPGGDSPELYSKLEVLGWEQLNRSRDVSSANNILHFSNLPCTSKEPLSLGDLLTFSTSCCVFTFIFSFCGSQKRGCHCLRNTRGQRHSALFPNTQFVIQTSTQCFHISLS